MRSYHKFIHFFSFLVGLALFFYSIVSAIFFSNPRFYTIFALGAYFILDFIDYKINKTSIMTFFLNRRHWYAFPLFLLFATVACFTVDFILGVNIAKMWKWNNYDTFDFLIMFLFMNASYVLGMYEIFRIINKFFEGKISEKHLVRIRIDHRISSALAVFGIFAGSAGMLIPFYIAVSGSLFPMEFMMLLPFVGLVLIPDSLTFLLRGKPVLPEIFRGNLNVILTLFFTIFVASLGTEVLNLFGREWEYLKMPFSSLMVLNVPLAVFVGWIPLVISTICTVTLVKHLTYLHDLRRR